MVVPTVNTTNMTDPNINSTSTTAEPTEKILGGEEFNEAQKVASVVILVVIMVCALIGNTLVIWAFTRYRRLRRVTNYFIVSLACSDILVATLPMPLWISKQLGWVDMLQNIPLLKAWTSMDVFSSTASIYHLSFVSLDRFLCITSPMTYHYRMTSRRAKISIAFVWFYSFILAFINYQVWGSSEFPVIVTILTFVLPLLLISIGYFEIFKAARYQAKQISLTVRGKSKKFSLTRELKAARTIGVVISAFVICWGPFFAFMIVYTQTTVDIPNIDFIISIAMFLHYGNSMLNPIIYTVMNKEFRSAFKQIIMMKAWSAFSTQSTNSQANLDRSSHSDENKGNQQGDITEATKI